MRTAATCVALIGMLTPWASAQLRPFPDTSDGIHVFYDQMYEGLSAAQIQFAATHYAGTQKMRNGAADALRAVNPSFLVLHYQLGMGAGPAALIVCTTPTGSDWGSDWSTIDANEPWFIHDAQGNRCLQMDWSWYLMDLTNTAWLDYWTSRALERVACTHGDGVFADSTGDPWNMSTLPPWLQGDPYAFAPYVSSLLAYVKGRFAGQAYMIPNAGPLVTTNSRMDYSDADGIMVEGFIGWGEGSPHAWPADWKLEMDRLIDLSRAGKIVLCQTSISTVADIPYRTYVLSTYLLVKGRKTTINLLPDDVDNFNPVWLPEWDLPVGSFAADLPPAVDDLYDAGWGVYRRDYGNALILVNPDPGVTRTVSLGATFQLPLISGGGEVGPSGTPSGSVAYQPVTSVTLTGLFGVVLIKTLGNPAAAEVVLAPGPGSTNPPRIRAASGTGALLPLDITAYGVARFGANVAAGNVDGTGGQEVLSGPGPGDVFGPQVRGFAASGSPLAKINFYAYGTLRYGARVGGGSVDGDAAAEIATAPGPGAVFGPHVRGWNYDGISLAPLPGLSFYAFPTLRYGCHADVAPLGQTTRGDLLVGAGPGAVFGTQVRGFRYTGASTQAIGAVNFFAFASGTHGARVAGAQVDADSYDEIAVGRGPAPAAAEEVRLFGYDAATVAPLPGGLASPFPGLAYGAVPGAGDADADGREELLVAAGSDPAAPTALRAFRYAGATLTSYPPLTIDPFGLSMGMNVAGGDLGI